MRLIYSFSYNLAKFILKIFWGLRVEGKHNLPATGPVVVASNHIAFLDPPAVAVSLFREAHFAAKQDLFRIPVLGKIISNLNAFPVKRTGFDNRAIKISLEVLRKGGVLIVFPEGTRSRSGEMLPFRRGVGYFVSKTGAAVLPTYISGSNHLKRNLLKPGGITVKFGEPIFNLASDSTGSQQFEEIAARVRAAIEKIITF